MSKTKEDAKKEYKTLYNEFEEKLGRVVQNEGGRDKNVLNRLEIDAHIRTARKLFIPGSSIKGALKTPFFQFYLNEEDDPNIAKKRGRNGETQFADDWFGKFEKDIFSKLKIGDATSEDLSSKVFWVVNKHRKKDSDNRPLSQRLECIVPDSELFTQISMLKSFPFDTDNFRIVVKISTYPF